MPLDPSRIFGTPIADRSLSYEDRDAMLYALCCGADRAVAEGDFRNVREEGLQVVPSFGQNLCFFDDWMQPAGVDIAKVVHGGLDLRMEAPFAASGEVTVKTRIGGLTDKGEGKAALALQISEVWQGGKRVFTSYSNFFVMGAGGFGGSQGEAFASEAMPEGEPDQTHDLPTRGDSPLLFRLLGDRNPLHIDPDTARKIGFERPIMHGANTFGIACLEVLRRFADGDAARMRRFTARFTGPLFPGETLRLSCWTTETGRIRFTARAAERDAPVLDGGLAAIDPAAG